MRHDANRHIAIALGALFLVVAGGTIGFMVIEGWSLGDALYMVVLSVTTTGFQEVHPLSTEGRVLTTLIIIAGLLAIGYLAGRAAQLLIESYLFRRRRMERKLRKIKNHYIVCGYGRMGYHICNDLYHARVPFVVVEQDDSQGQLLDMLGYPFIIGNASSDGVLERANIREAKGLITVVTSDAENVFTTLSAKSLRPDIYVVARALDDEAASKLKKAGADRVVKPFEDVGHRLTQLLLKPGVVEFMDQIGESEGRDISMEEIPILAPSDIIGTPLRELPFRSEYNVIIVAIRRESGEFIYNPGADIEMYQNDRIIVIGESSSLSRLATRCTGSAQVPGSAP